MTNVAPLSRAFHLLASVCALLALASCSGDSMSATTGDDGGWGSDSSGGQETAGLGKDLGTNSPTTSSCSFLPADATIALQITCSSFVPALAPYEVVFVDSTVAGPAGNQVVAHRFRATAACGFDVVVSLPNLQFAADDQPYQMSVWWLQNASTRAVDLLAIVIRRSLSGPVLLAVAAPGNTDLLNFLVSPLAVTLDGPACTDPAQAGNTSQILDINSAPLSCEDEAGGYSLRLCRDGDSIYRMVAYRGSPDSTALPGAFGASDLLVPIN